MDNHAEFKVLAFTVERVRALTGLSLRQLQYWDETNLVRPGLTARQGRGRKRLYSFQDLVALRVAAQLRNDGITLQQIRKVVGHLRNLDYSQPLAEIRFIVQDGQLYFNEADTWRAGHRPAQVVASFVVNVGLITNDLMARIAEMRKREPGAIERRRGTLGGQPVVRGTRITVSTIQRLARAGFDDAGIRELYPDLTSEDIRAALAWELPRRHRPRAS
jgi:uncharacterized protein (DUF433 family)